MTVTNYYLVYVNIDHHDFGLEVLWGALVLVIRRHRIMALTPPWPVLVAMAWFTVAHYRWSIVRWWLGFYDRHFTMKWPGFYWPWSRKLERPERKTKK